MKLFFIILLFSLQANSQIYFGRLVGSTPIPPTPGYSGDTIIYDSFDGSSLNSTYEVRRSDLQTITVSGGSCNIIGNGTFIPDYYPSWNSFMLRIKDTGYGYSMIRNYKIEVQFVLR